MTSRTGNVRVAEPNDQVTPGCHMNYNHTKIMRINANKEDKANIGGNAFEAVMGVCFGFCMYVWH